ncbi:MAG: AMP-binding protein, partial [Candidatus Onthomonas sp.]|nr:AMP-binding protein [Candidatus Onthomonas sp.]
MKNILEWLETIQHREPDRILFADEECSMSRTQFLHTAQSVGTALARLGTRNTPIALLMPRGVDCLTAMMGVAYSGNFYVVLDDAMPAGRMNTILTTLHPTAMVVHRRYLEQAAALDFDGPRLCFQDAADTVPDPETLTAIRRRMVDTDPLYALFTSGSTG